MENKTILEQFNELVQSEFNGNDAEFARYFGISRQSVYNARRKVDLSLTIRQILIAIELGKKIFEKKIK